MTMAELRAYRNVPARRGMRVICDGKPGVITGNYGDAIRVRLDGEKRSGLWHPWWRITYILPDGTTKGSPPKESNP